MKGLPQLDLLQYRLCCEESDEELLGRFGFARGASTVKFFKMTWKERRGEERRRIREKERVFSFAIACGMGELNG